MDKKSRHIALIRLSAMGDVAMVTHVVRALRSLDPDLKISIITRERFHPIFDGLGVNFVPLDLDGRHRGMLGMRRLAYDLRELGVDAVADLHNVIRSKMLRMFLPLYGISSAKLRKPRIDRWMRMDGGCRDVTKPMRHMVLHYCDVLRALGFDVDEPSQPAKCERPNPMELVKGDERWVGVAPFAAHKGKIYPLIYMNRVVEELSKRYDRVFIHGGGGYELEYAQQLEGEHSNVSALFGRITLGEEIALISNEDCIVTMDSFAMHVGSMVATPVVSVWGATHPSVGFSGYGCDPRGIVQLENLACRPCSVYGNKECRFSDYHCLNELDPMEIVDSVAKLIG